MSVLVQQPTNHFHQHQPRHTPPAPAKHTPGLIFLTRPLQSQKQQQQQTPQTPPRAPRQQRHRRQQDRSSSSSGNEDADSPRTPENKDKSRGRKPADGVMNTPSPFSGAGRKPKNAIAPPKSSSPKLSQAEAYTTANTFFSNVHTPAPRSSSKTTTAFFTSEDVAAPLIDAQPNGRIARQRRTTQHKTSNSVSAIVANIPTPTAPVPLPAPRRRQASPSPPNHHNLSKSEPSLSNMHPRNAPRNRTRAQKTQPLPLPDWDMPAAVADENTPPPSPTESNSSTELTWQQALLANGPRTAPLESPVAFTFPPVTPPRNLHRPSKHIRSPSYPTEALFNMSFDEEGPSQSPMANLPFKPRPVSGDRFAYAGPTFHNSPNASALPAPKFLGA